MLYQTHEPARPQSQYSFFSVTCRITINFPCNEVDVSLKCDVVTQQEYSFVSKQEEALYHTYCTFITTCCVQPSTTQAPQIAWQV